MPTYGLFFEVDRVKKFLTSDSQYCPNLLQEYYKQADIIFQDCELIPYSSPVHAHYDHLVSLLPEIKTKCGYMVISQENFQTLKKTGF